MKKLLRVLAWVIGIGLLTAVSFFGWLMYDFHESSKTDFWDTDSPPDSATKAILARDGIPDVVTRVVRVGASSRFNGDGEDLTIYCFDPSMLTQMKRALGGATVWEAGLPADSGWRWQIRDHAPADLQIGDSPDTSSFIHLPTPAGSLNWTIIDIRRAVSYQIRIRT
jgi:hypothetical protein